MTSRMTELEYNGLEPGSLVTRGTGAVYMIIDKWEEENGMYWCYEAEFIYNMGGLSANPGGLSRRVYLFIGDNWSLVNL